MSSIALPVIAPDESLVQYLREIKRFPSLTLEEEVSLAERWYYEKDLEAAHRLVTSHLKLVCKIAVRFRGYGMPLMDLVAEGNIGLMQAVKRFDPTKGFRLATYAMWWIKASIQEYILRSWSLVRIGTTAAQRSLFFNLRKLKNRILALENRSLNDQDVENIAHELGVSTKDVLEMDSRLSQGDCSLNEMVGTDEGEGTEMLSLIPSEEPSHELVLAETEEKQLHLAALQQAMETLSPRERDIIMKRKLMQPPVTLKDLSEIYALSCERVRQIEEASLVKLRRAMERFLPTEKIA